MAKIKRIVALLLISVLCLAGCSDNVTANYTSPKSFNNAENCVVDENNNFVLSWDNAGKCVLFTNKKTGYIWSTTPYDFFQSGETNYSMSSPVVIDYYDSEDNSVQTEKALDCIEEDTVSSEIKDKKLFETFYFKGAEISVTISFALENDSLKVSLCSDDLREYGNKKLINVAVTPFLCSVKNSSSKDSYLFVPSGCGALMYVDNSLGETNRTFTQEVYGNDPARTQLDNPGDEEAVRLPCFGATDGKNAMFGIIEGEAGSAFVKAEAGMTSRGYSNCYVMFNVRGYNNIEWAIGDYHGSATSNDVVMLDESWPKGRNFTVGYYPLSGEQADYNGMANCYKNYLNKNGYIEKTDVEQKTYAVTLVGGAQEKAYFCGIPYNSLHKITDFKDAKSICEKLIETSGTEPLVVLNGFGNSGINIGKIAGGYSYASKLGSKSERVDFERYCQNSSIQLFCDYNLIKFSSSGKGFNTFFNSAETANSETVSYYPKDKSLRTNDEDSKSIKLLSRESISKAVDKLIKFVDSQKIGVSLSSLTSTAYSDYAIDNYMLKGKAEIQTIEVIDKIKKSGHKVLATSANFYSAGLSDSILSVPLQNGAYSYLDEEIPFYEMVFSGIVPMYSSAINLSLNSENSILKAVESGVSPSFTVGKSVDVSLIDNDTTFFYGIEFDNNVELIEKTVKNLKGYYERISGASIESHALLEGNITKTVFSNGVKVYVNYSSSDATVDGVSVAAKSFVY